MAYTREKRRAVRDVFVLGRGTVTDLGKRFGIRRQTIAAWAERENWEELRTMAERKANEKRAEELAERFSKCNADVLDTWDSFLDRVRARLEADAAGPMPAADLDALSRICARLQGGQRIALNADAPGEAVTREFVVSYTPLRQALLESAHDAEEALDDESGSA